MSEIPPGWYDNPENPMQYRYWDGAQWTEHWAPKVASAVGTQGDGAWDVVPQALSLLGRTWKQLIVLAVPMLLLIGVGVGALYQSFDAALSPGLPEIIERVSETGFDPSSGSADEAFIDSIEFDVEPSSVAGWVVGGLMLLVGLLLPGVLIWVHLASALRGRPLDVAATYRQTMRRLPRIIGIWMLWALVGLIVVAVIGVIVAVAPAALILIIPAGLAFVVYAWPIGTLAMAMLMVGPSSTPPLRGAISLVSGRWGAIAVRILALTVIVGAISLGTQFATGQLTASSIVAGIVASLLLQIALSAMSTAGSIVVYDWAGGDIDADLEGAALDGAIDELHVGRE